MQYLRQWELFLVVTFQTTVAIVMTVTAQSILDCLLLHKHCVQVKNYWSSNYNWFELVDLVVERTGNVEEIVITQLEKSFLTEVTLGLSAGEKLLIEQSHQALILDQKNSHLADREANALNGHIVTDSESDDPNDYLGMHDFKGSSSDHKEDEVY